MLKLRPSLERGRADHGWLQSFHSFSFADYFDAAHMGWGNLRVINEDRIAPGSGFGTHGHRDMEIISYVLSGELAHRDSMGNVKAIPPGDVQRMSAGSGVQHSEFNHAAGQTTHFLQIWIEPSQRGIAPSYAQQTIAEADKRGRLCKVAGGAGVGDAQAPKVSLNADAALYAGLFDAAEQSHLELAPGRLGYVQVLRGVIEVNGLPLSAGDAVALKDEPHVALRAGQHAEVLVFDLRA